MNMDFNGPGTSLFQGSDLNSFDNNAQREEEEEAIEDQRRRDIELKNMLENAFDDVSFDNEDCSELNSSFNQLHLNSDNKSHNFVNEGININKSQSSISDFNKHYSDDHPKEFHTPIRHSKNIRTKTIDFNNHYDNDTYQDEFRIKQQNGSLHDIVDASGGGDAGFSLHYNHYVGSNSVGECKSFPTVPAKTDNVMSLNKVYQNTEYNSIEQLEILYEVRVREVHRLTKLVDQMKNQHEVEKSELKRELAFAAAEKERYKISHNEVQNLLISNKEENEMLKRETNELKKGISKLEESKEQLLIELETSRATINDLERKLLAIEKGRKDKTVLMQYEVNLQELQEKYTLDVKKATEELNIYKTNFEKANKENDELKYKVIQLNQINDENLAKKSEIINRLSKQIEEMQEQCEKLMKSSFSEDNIKLQMEIKILTEENNNLSSKLQDLEKSLANQEAELKQYECLSNFSPFDKNLSESTSDKENEYSEINRKLREELFRALNSQKARRQEIQSLQTLIKKKDEQIHCMAEKERIFLAEAAKFRNEIGIHISELKKHENISATKENENKKLQDLLNNTKRELEAELKNNQKKNQELQKENECLQEELKIVRNNLEKDKIETMSKYNEEYLKFHNEGLKKVKEELQQNFKIELLGKNIEIENLKKEVEEVKNLYVEVYNEKESLLNKLDKEKISLNRSSVDVDEVKRLQKELEKSRQRILDLDLTLRRQYQQEVEKLNGDIKCLNLELEKLKKEKDYESTEKDKIITVNELLKTEIEQVTSEKNLYFLKCETLRKEIDELKSDLERLQKESNCKLNNMAEQHSQEAEDIRNRYEIQIQKLNKEIELMLTRSICTESKYTSPIKQYSKNLKSTGVQGSPVSVQSASTSPICKSTTQESCTSPICDLKKDGRMLSSKALLRDKSILTDLEPKSLSKVEVIRMMEQLGMGHEEEMNLLEKKYKAELVKLDRKWQSEVDLITEKLRVDMMTAHSEELEKLHERHRIEMENRIEQEKKEAVVALITEWAFEAQTLKQSRAETQAEVEKMKMKYKAAKHSALRYKTYFTNKTELMKEEWRKVKDDYEKALKELEKNVHLLVDIREDEVKAKVESIATAYEQKINKMKYKLEKCEDLLRNEIKDSGNKVISSRNSNDERKSKDSASDKGLDRLVIPNTHLCRKSKQNGMASKEGKTECLTAKSHRTDRNKKTVKDNQCKKLYVDEAYDVDCSPGIQNALKKGNS